MQPVKKPVNGRRQQHTNVGNKRHTAENGVNRRKHLAAIACNFSHRAHARQNHRRIVKRVNPRQITGKMVAQHANCKTENQKKTAPQQISVYSLIVNLTGCKRLALVFVHFLPFI